MAKPILLANRFDRMVRDEPRNNMPPGAMWNMVDWIPGELDAPLVKRGGFTYESELLSGTHASADFADTLIYAPFTAGGQLLAITIDEGGGTARLLRINSTSSTTDRGATLAAITPMTFYRDKVYITSYTGASAPYVYDGTSNATVLTTSPPSARYSCVYKDRLVLAGSAAQPQRIYFSGAGDPTSWDTANRWIDTSAEITGIYPLRNAILIWHRGTMERIIGSIPPPGTDMTLQPLSDVGLHTLSSWSLAGTDEFVCFASESGVHMTDGASVADLTEQGGIKSYWYELMETSLGVFSGGWYRGYYFISNVGDDLLYVCHMASRRWFMFSNFNVRSFARRVGGIEELFFGLHTAPRVCSMSSVFDPVAGVKNDATGTAVAPVLETPYYDLAQSKSTIRKLYANYDLRDAASDNPVLTMSTILSPELTSYTDVVGQNGSGYTLAETTERTRVRRLLRKPSFGVALKLAQSNASSATRLYSLEAEAHGREDSRV